MTQNIAALRIDAALDESPIESIETRPSRHVYGTVNPEEAQAALADPHVAKVIDVFRGRIVDIRRGARTADA